MKILLSINTKDIKHLVLERKISTDPDGFGFEGPIFQISNPT